MDIWQSVYRSRIVVLLLDTSEHDIIYIVISRLARLERHALCTHELANQIFACCLWIFAFCGEDGFTHMLARKAHFFVNHGDDSANDLHTLPLVNAIIDVFILEIISTYWDF